MRKLEVFLIMCVVMGFVAACGNSKTSTTTTYDVPTAIALPYPSPLGGSIQNTSPLALSNPVTVTTFAGSSAGFSNTSSVGSVMFNRPISITTDGTNLYVADYVNNAIRQISIATRRVTTIAGNGALDSKGVAVSFNLPSSITTDGANLYVTDSGNRIIRKIDLSTKVVSTLAGESGVSGTKDDIGTNARFNILNGITTDGTNLYVTDSNNTIRRITISSGKVTTLAGSPGTTGSTDGTQAAARFNQPARLTTDGLNLYVTDFANSLIRKIELKTGAVTTIAGKATPGGTAGSHADSTDGTGQTARFNQPNGITCDGPNLYVTDSYDNSIRKIVLSSGTVYSGAVTTLAGAETGFNTPVGITTDGKSLFIADNQNHTIRQIQ